MESLLLPLVMFGGLGALMYFQVKKQKRVAASVQQMQDSVTPGVEVMTTSGLHGHVVSVTDDHIFVEVAPGVTTKWVRAAVREVIVPPVDSLEDDLNALNTDSVILEKSDKRDLG
ncbi:preprotein translocase subunit YajC [Nakamurella silvestris]|nr:preprotein translocase subunit YajC [Nakamurella silvestris]